MKRPPWSLTFCPAAFHTLYAMHHTRIFIQNNENQSTLYSGLCFSCSIADDPHKQTNTHRNDLLQPLRQYNAKICRFGILKLLFSPNYRSLSAARSAYQFRHNWWLSATKSISITFTRRSNGMATPVSANPRRWDVLSFVISATGWYFPFPNFRLSNRASGNA